MSNETQLQDMVKQYKEVRELRMKLDRASKELKEGKESELQAGILQLMLESNVQSVHFPGVGRVVRVVKSHYEIADKEQFAAAMFRSMSAAASAGRPLAETVLAQFRVSKEALEGYIEDSGETAESCGITQVDKPELSIRKS